MSDKLSTETEQPAYMRLVALFRSQGVTPNSPLPTESDLARDLGVGRQQVREALSTLEGFGAVASRQGARRIWVGFSSETFARRATLLLDAPHESMREFLEVRHALETSMLPRVVNRLTRGDLAHLRGLANDMIVQVNAGGSFADLDEQFHRALFGPLDNGVLDGLLGAFWGVFETNRMHEEQEGRVAEDPDIAAMHGRILDAIEDGDTLRAVHELDAHFYGVRNRFPNISFGSAAPSRA